MPTLDAAQLPDRGTVIVRGGYVLTLDDALGDLPGGEVVIRDGTIEAVRDPRAATGVAVGPSSMPDDATVVDATGCVVLPGFVDTHWHLWNSILRGLIGDGERAYFPVKNRLAPFLTAHDTEVSARLALAEATWAGITTLNDWDHNLRAPEYADANARAITASGLRARYSYGNADKLDPGRHMDLDDVLRFRDEWVGDASEGRISLGVALRGPVRTEPAVCRDEWDFARANGLPITMHCGGRRDEGGRYCELASMGAQGMLGPDVQIVHAVHATPAEIDLLATTGTHISLSPLTEYRSMGIPPLGDLLAAGIPVSLSIDTLAIPTTADMLLQMNVTLSVERARSARQDLTPRRMVRMATLDGARDLGLDDRIGSLTPGKRADVIAVRVDGLGSAPAVDPVATMVLCGRASDVDLVIADGRILKQDGRLTATDARAVTDEASATLADLVRRAGWDVPLGVAADRPVVSAG
ncbi:MAG: amidohydrolase family protein [Chloroflexi bacterium]|nr:amidohydrolase family protein [Chloroflexota bacterium]